MCGGGVAGFVALTTAAAWCYPGGTWWDRRARGYSLWQNFLCDLFHHRALNGRDNATSASLATAGALAMLVAMAAFFALLARAAPASRAARVARAVGVASCALGVAIPLTPSDRHRAAHLAVMLGISVPALVALGAAAVVTVRGRSRVAAGFAVLTAVFASVDALAYAIATQTRVLDLALAPVQRLAMLSMLGWITAVLAARAPQA
ncbi:MAG: hypothetical protein U0325_27865 [Polyangiales bacterium]